MTVPTHKCGLKTEVYSRVVGYHRPTSNWNKGKQEEFRNRKMFGLSSIVKGIQQRPVKAIGVEK